VETAVLENQQNVDVWSLELALCLPCPGSPQVCLEGEISRQSILNSLSRGKKASGDLIPWTVSEQVKGYPCMTWVSKAGEVVGGCLCC
jgi:hypothetical protein